ncbi:MAG: Crp/Fnr family transcriptional regulator [Lachnospiraceae bacterium]
MKSSIDFISDSALFKNIKITELYPMLKCLGCYIKTYKKGEYISLENEQVKSIGLVLNGTVHMIKEDIWGNTTILAYIESKQLFGETFTCGSDDLSSVTFYASTEIKVLFMAFERVMHSCSLTCIFHHKLIENMVMLIADKNKHLLEKLEIISKKTLREKILAYLSLQAQRHNTTYFEIPFDRYELANYLCADRSALSRELSTMKNEGIIDYEKNLFRIL